MSEATDLSNKKNIGLFYGSSTCYTEMAAEKIRDWFQANSVYSVQLHNVVDAALTYLAQYQYVILGIPTWDYGELQEDWENQWETLCQIDFTGKTVALFGLGDQIGYPEWFQDALGYLYQRVIEQGGKVVGFWPNEGYEFIQSQALTDDKQFFVGLALDDENEFDKSALRIDRWCQQLVQDFS